MAASRSAVYVTGGYDGEDFNPDVRAVWSYRPTLGFWVAAADMPAPRAAHASVGIGDLIYVVGGVGTGSNALWVYNSVADTWDTSRPPLPTPREHLAAATVGGKLYVIGGRWGGQGNLRTLEIYDPATNTWTRGRDMPTARGGITASAVGGLIHVTGGEDLGSSRTYEQHEVYDPATDTWATYPRLPTSRHGLASAAVDGRWYVIGGGMLAGGGTYSSLSNAVEVFVP
jgi:N-acetylneuraminic acid mutarotase